MAKLPDATALGALRPASSARIPTARISTRGATAGARASARALQQVGGDIQSIGVELGARANKEAEYETERKFQEFKLSQQQSLHNRINGQDDGDIGSFTTRTQGGYQRDAKSFMENNVPQQLKQRYDLKLFNLEKNLSTSAQSFQAKEQKRVSVEDIDKLGDTATAQAREVESRSQVGDLIRGISDTVRANPYLTDAEKDAKIKTEAKKIALAYLDSRDPENRINAIKAERGRRRGGGAIGDVVDRIIAIESGGKFGAKNPRSSAGGLGQFIDSTWLAMVKRHRPDIAAGRSDKEIIGLKTREEFAYLSREMTQRYLEDNGNILERAGFDATPGNLYLAHFLGAGGALKALRADSDKSASEILGAGVVKANPHLKGMTVADVVAWAKGKMGGNSETGFSQFTDNELSRISKGAKNELEAQRKAAEKAAEDAAKEAYKDAKDKLFMDAEEGRVTEADVKKLNKDGFFKSYSDYSSALSHTERAQNKIRDQRIIESLVAGEAPYNPANPKHKKLVDVAYENSGLNDKLMQSEPEAGTALVSMAKNMQAVPKTAAGTISHMVQSKDKESTIFALQTANQIRKESPAAFESFSKSTQRKAILLETQAPYISEKELMERITKLDDPNLQKGREAREKESAKLTKDVTGSDVVELLDLDTLLEFSDPEVAIGLGGALPSNISEKMALDYKDLFRAEYGEHGDADLARDVTIQRMQRLWQRSDVTGRAVIMRNAPETHLPTFKGTHKWVGKKLFSEIKDKSMPISPHADKGDVMTVPKDMALVPVPNFNPRSPKWQIMYMDEDGTVQIMLDKNAMPLVPNFTPPSGASELRGKRSGAITTKDAQHLEVFR